MGPWMIFALLSILSLTSAEAEDRAHGLNNESPVALSPQAYSFFHPNTNNPCTTSSNCSIPLAATVKSTPAHESASSSSWSPHGRTLMTTGAVVGLSLGVVLAGLVAMGAYYVTSERRENLKRANPVLQV